MQPFHPFISSSNLLLDFSTFNLSFPPHVFLFLLPSNLYQTDRRLPVGSHKLVKTPIRNIKNQQVGLLATASHDRENHSLHLASSYCLPFLSAAFQRCTFTPPLTTSRGDVHQKPSGKGQTQGWTWSGVDGKQCSGWRDKWKTPERAAMGNKLYKMLQRGGWHASWASLNVVKCTIAISLFPFRNMWVRSLFSFYRWRD